MWEERQIAGRRVFFRAAGGAAMLFSCGPPRSRPCYPEVAAGLLDALAGRVTAVRWCEQVHGRLLASLAPEPGDAFTGAACVGRCDGMLTAEPGVGLVVWTADCVPVLLSGGGVVGAVHAGWRGAAAGVVPAAVRRFEVEYGVPPGALRAALGPAVGPCHYEVGDEVVAALERNGVDPQRWRRDRRVDLRGFLLGQLEAAGVPAGACSIVGGCTACDPRCASYRRDGDEAGRQWSLVVLER